jgi:hypothetical protein
MIIRIKKNAQNMQASSGIGKKPALVTANTGPITASQEIAVTEQLAAEEPV